MGRVYLYFIKGDGVGVYLKLQYDAAQRKNVVAICWKCEFVFVGSVYLYLYLYLIMGDGAYIKLQYDAVRGKNGRRQLLGAGTGGLGGSIQPRWVHPCPVGPSLAPPMPSPVLRRPSRCAQLVNSFPALTELRLWRQIFGASCPRSARFATRIPAPPKLGL